MEAAAIDANTADARYIRSLGIWLRHCIASPATVCVTDENVFQDMDMIDDENHLPGMECVELQSCFLPLESLKAALNILEAISAVLAGHATDRSLSAFIRSTATAFLEVLKRTTAKSKEDSTQNTTVSGARNKQIGGFAVLLWLLTMPEEELAAAECNKIFSSEGVSAGVTTRLRERIGTYFARDGMNCIRLFSELARSLRSESSVPTALWCVLQALANLEASSSVRKNKLVLKPTCAIFVEALQSKDALARDAAVTALSKLANVQPDTATEGNWLLDTICNQICAEFRRHVADACASSRPKGKA